MCYLSKKYSKYFSFCDTVFSSWGHSDQICYLPYCFIPKKKGKTEKKKGTPPWYVKVGGHHRLAMVCERKSGEECQAL
jgi:hypothetical protein